MPDVNDHIRRVERVGAPPATDHAHMMTEFEANGGKVQVIPDGAFAMDTVSPKYGEYQSKISTAVRRELG